MLFRLFHEETVRVYDPLHIRKECRCNRDRLVGVLKAMPRDDIDYLEDNGRIAMRCEFCNTEYVFTKEELSHENAS